VSSKFLTIQDSFKVEPCIKCGRRPVIEQRGTAWIVLCKKDACNNEVAGKYVDFEAWNDRNKK
jgi:hypothetical protein